ncbi:homoserine kinase [Clostridiaceae bacterium M8S5]|nr:homoserine kinase [Clostridiaceae bacterium M8S5]
MIKITVPATSANMGPGFDSLGVAFDIQNNFFFEQIEKGVILKGCPQEYKNENNLVYRSMKIYYEVMGKRINGIRIIFNTQIPVSRGLGSSASCSVAGIMAANYFCGNILDKKEMLKLATEIEGHPDNVAPAIFGGMITSLQANDRVLYSKVKIDKCYKFYVMIPNFMLSTKMSRGVLPKEISYKDAVFNVSRVALLISTLSSGEDKLLKEAFKDKLHQPYRGKLIPGYEVLNRHLNDMPNTACFISGAGSTLGIISTLDRQKVINNLKELSSKMGNEWIIKEVKIDNIGARIIK